MDFDWQEITVMAIVVLAASYLFSRGWRSLMSKTKNGCGACGGSSGKVLDSGTEKGFVPLEEIRTKT